MRRIHRLALPTTARAYLNRRKAQTLGHMSVDRAWKVARQTRALKDVLGVLHMMMGERERCMYCVDSHGSDIDHFWPKSRYADKAFDWENMLLSCTECGRLKGSQFPLEHDGQPLLVNPCTDDPWLHIDFDPDTGNLTARYDPATGLPSAKGERTVQILQLDRREGMAAGYRRTYLRILRCVHDALDAHRADIETVLTELQQSDDHGLWTWCFVGSGARTPPFVELQRRMPELWAACIAVAH